MFPFFLCCFSEGHLTPLCVNFFRSTPRIIMKSDFCFKKTSEKLEKQWKCGEGHYYKRDNEGVRKLEARSITQKWFVPAEMFRYF